MASGSFTGSGSGVQLVISWSSSKGTGGSTVTATLYAQNVGGSYWYATVNQGYSLTINGDTKSGNTAKLSSSANGRVALLSHSVWVSYTGSKSINISGSANLSNIYFTTAGSYLGTRSVSGTAGLDNVGTAPSAPTCTAPTAHICSDNGETVTISWTKASSYTSSGAGYNVDYNVDGAGWARYKDIANINTLSTTFSIPAGVNGVWQFRVRSYNPIGNSGWSNSSRVTRNSISAPTIGDIPVHNPFLTSTLTIPLTGGGQANSKGVYRYAALYYGDTLLANCTTPALNNTSVTISYSAANFAAKLGTAKYSDTFKIIAYNKNENNRMSSTVTKTFTVNLNSDGGATPTIAAPTFSGGYTGYTSTCFIAGIHNLIVTSPSAVARRAPSGVTFTYKIECTGATAKTGSSATFTRMTSGTKTVKVTVTDSRGLSASVTKTCIFQSYASPKIKITSAERLASPNTSGKVVYTVSYSPIYGNGSSGTNLNGINTQQYRKNSVAWTNYTSGSTITGLSTDIAYKIEIRVADKIKTSTYSIVSEMIPTVKSGLSIREYGVGIQCVPQDGYSFEVSGVSRFDDSIIYNIEGRDREPVMMLAGGQSAGDGVMFGNSGGLVVLGSGESCDLFKNTGMNSLGLVSSSEETYILSDGGVYIVTGLQNGWSSGKTFTFANTGNMVIPSNAYIDGNIVVRTNGVTSQIYNNSSKSMIITTTGGNIHANQQLTAQYGITANGDITSRSQLYGKAIELSMTTPYIDFHYNNSSSDFTSRIIEQGVSGQLYLNNSIAKLTGDFYVGNSLCLKGPSVYSRASNGRIMFRGITDLGCFYFGDNPASGGGMYALSTVGSSHPKGLGVNGECVCAAGLTVYGTKKRAIKTENFGIVGLNAVESPSCLFQDYGKAKTNDDGLCYIYTDLVFAETIEIDMGYYVLLTKMGEGDLWCDKRERDYFIVKGTPNLEFTWCMTANQKDYTDHRLANEWGNAAPKDLPQSELFNEDVVSETVALEQLLMEKGTETFKKTLKKYLN